MPARATTATLVIACGSIGVAVYWWFARRRRSAINPTSPASPPEDFKQSFESIILSTNITDNAPPLDKLHGQLKPLLEFLTPAQIDQLKSLSDEISYAVSEWYFYHTLRTNRSINWNPQTGVIDEALSPEERQLGSQLAKAIRQAFWDNHLNDLAKDPPDFSRIIERIDELNTRLTSYLRPNPNSPSIIDVEIVRQLLAQKKFTKSSFIQLIERTVQVMYDIESPAAHEDTIKWAKDTVSDLSLSVDLAPTAAEIVSVLRFLFEQLDLVDSEIANYKTSHFPYAKRVEQERQIFKHLVDEGVLPVPRLDDMLKAIPDTCTIEDTKVGITKLIHQHVLMVIRDRTQCIETLNLDTEKLDEFSKKRSSIIVLSSFLVGVHSQVSALFPSDRAKEFLSNRLSIDSLIRDVWESGSVDSCDLTDHLIASLLQFSLEVTTETVAALNRGISQCVRTSSKVRQLYERRVSDLLSSGELNETCMGTNPWFLNSAVTKLHELVTDLERFVTEHLTVYMPVYRELVGKRSLDELD